MRPVTPVALLAALAMSGCISVVEQSPPPVVTTPSGKTVLVPGNALFSPAVRGGDTVFLSGVIGRSDSGDAREATRQAMNSVKGNIEKAGGTMADLLKCTVFLTDIDHYAAMNEVYAEYFVSEPPARTAIAVSALPFGALVEVECIAAAR